MNNFIWAFGFVTLIFGVNGAGEDEHLQLRQKCFDELGFTKDERSATGSSTYFAYPKIDCYLSCILGGLHLFNDDGSINSELAVNAVDEDIREQVRPLINKCVIDTASIADKCKKSFAAVKCLHEGAGESFQLLGFFEPAKKS